MPRVKAGNIHMYYMSHGKGEPLVFINGRHMCRKLLWMHIPVFAQEYRVITFDNRCCGRSDAPDTPCTIITMADDLAALLDAIGIESAHFCGYSMGTKVAEEFALKYPRRVKSLILVCYAPPNPDAPNGPIWTIPQRIEALKRPVEERMWHLYRQCVSEDFIDNNPELAEKMVKIMAENAGPLYAQKRHVEASFSHNNYYRLPEIKAPALVVAGGVDITCPLDDMRSMARRIPGAELKIVVLGGHFLMWECFTESNNIMLEFLRKHTA
jgi:pimeloyl-ACP methyl ester carboxylesterase